MLAPVNEAHTELVRVKELLREEQLRATSKRAFQVHQEQLALRRNVSEGVLKRAGERSALEVQLTRPNVWRYAKPQRQLRHQVRHTSKREVHMIHITVTIIL